MIPINQSVNQPTNNIVRLQFTYLEFGCRTIHSILCHDHIYMLVILLLFIILLLLELLILILCALQVGWMERNNLVGTGMYAIVRIFSYHSMSMQWYSMFESDAINSSTLF